MQTRREIIRTLTAGVAASAIGPAGAKSSPREVCLKEAGQLADTMRKLAGGQWRVTVDKDLEFVLVSKIL
jgi:hypothetical protein